MKIHHPRARNAIKLAIVFTFVSLLRVVALCNAQQTAQASSSGPSPSHTDAPGEDNCTACHVSFPVNSGTGSVSIVGIPHDYIPGHQYSVSVTTSQSDATIYGFQMTA